MKDLVKHIEDLTVENNPFRRVFHIGKHLQLVLLALKPDKKSGTETHLGHDQLLQVEKCNGDIWIDGEPSKIRRDDPIIALAQACHNIINTGSKRHKLYSPLSSP